VPERRLDDASDAAALDAMRARVFRVHRCGAERLPGRLPLGGRIAIDIAVAYGRDRPPEIEMVLGIQHSDDRVVEADRPERHEPRAVEDAHLLCGRELAYEGVVRYRRADQPEPGRLRLLGRSFRAVLSTIIFDLVVVGSPLLAIERN